jgi:hypothetical protein
MKQSFQHEQCGGIVRGLFTLIPSESKRLIAKAVAALPEVQHALKHGRLVIGLGTTNGYIIRELLGRDIDPERHTAGWVTDGELKVQDRDIRPKGTVLIKGEPVDMDAEEAVQDFTPDDVIIKGANAVDMSGVAGVLLASEVGGTIGNVIGVLAARGSHLIIAVGLEKLIPSVDAAADMLGIQKISHAIGKKVGMMPLRFGQVVTEIDALDILFGVEAVHVASGGVLGSEGAVTIAIEGEEERVKATMDLVREIKKG